MSTLCVVLSPIEIRQFLDDLGVPVAGGFLYTYEAGTAFGIPQDVYTDSDLSVPFENPVPLNSAGRPSVAGGAGVPLYFAASPAYDLLLKNALGVTIWTATNITP